MADIATYDVVKGWMIRNNQQTDSTSTHVIASVTAGFAAAVASTPADVVKSRVMNQPTDSRGRGLYYRSSIHCLYQTVRDEGSLALYKGFIPTWTRLAPWTLTFWVVYEKLRQLFNVAGF